MKLWNVLLLLFAAAPGLLCGQWIRMDSPHFELYTTATAEEARATLQNFEQARSFFLSIKAFPITPGMPVVLVAFSSAKEYQPYSFKEFMPAYFVGNEQRDYIVMSDLRGERARIAIHEYVHVLVRHSGLPLPLWLNEGLAEVYSAMELRDEGKKVLIGNIPKDRAYTLGSGTWLRLGRVLDTTAESPEYSERTRAGMFYSQSCLLVHMLMLGDSYRDKFVRFLEKIAGAESAAPVFAEVYGKSVAEVEADMLTYFRQSHIGGAVYTSASTTFETTPAREGSALEVELLLARLAGLLGRVEEANTRLEKLLATHKENREIEEAQAYLAWHSGDLKAAVRKFEDAVSRGGSNWKTYWDYARLLIVTNGDRAEKLHALRKAVDLHSGLPLARVMLARELHASGKRADAIEELRKAELHPREPAATFLLRARTAAELGEMADARRYADEAKTYARAAHEAAQLEELLREVERREAARASDAAAVGDNQIDEERPILRRHAPPKPAGARRR